MRLVRTDTLKFEEFHGKPPRYVILSHTWGHEDEEVSFMDMCGNKAASKRSGYSKILGLCKLARETDCEYFWIDTCCIGKSSSAELNESINSMFQWYKNAEACYVYLSDVSIDGPQYADQWRSSRWFTRGWTLQELLAPLTVRFYDCQWRYCGEKKSSRLRRLIAEITSIDEEVLLDSELIFPSAVARKMSWAARRQTTRVEDTAYCLLGLFGVNMPLLYGEGRRAFIRLQEEILRRSADMSLFAWTTPSKENYRGILARSPSEFRVFCDHDFGQVHSEYYAEACLTNRGYRITAEISSCQFGSEYVMDLGYIMKEGTLHGRIGVLLVESRGSFVRVRPQQVVCSSGKSWEKKLIFALLDIDCASTLPLPRENSAPTQHVHETSPEICFPGQTKSTHYSSDAQLQGYADLGSFVIIDNPLGVGGRFHRSEELIGYHLKHQNNHPTRDCARWNSSAKGVSGLEPLIHQLSVWDCPQGRYLEGASKPSLEADKDMATPPTRVRSRAESLSNSEPETQSDVEDILQSGHPFLSHRIFLADASYSRFRSWLRKTAKSRRPCSRPAVASSSANSRPNKRLRHHYSTSEGLERENYTQTWTTAGGSFKERSDVLLGCPLYVYDNSRYWRCLRNRITNISGLVHHLQICHMQPLYCPLCGETFQKTVLRDEHVAIRQCERQTQRGFDGLRNEQVALLIEVTERHASLIEKWYQIWDIIYPGGIHPESVHLVEGTVAKLAKLHAFWGSQGREIIGSHLSEHGLLSWELPNEERDLEALSSIIYLDLLHRYIQSDDEIK
jgi:hypothetical protein